MSDSVEKEISEPESSDCKRHNSSEMSHVNAKNKQTGVQIVSRKKDLSRETSKWEAKFPSNDELKREPDGHNAFQKILESSNRSEVTDGWGAAQKNTEQVNDINSPTNEQGYAFSRFEKGNKSRKQTTDGQDVVLHEDKEQDTAICKSEEGNNVGRQNSDGWETAFDKNDELGTALSKSGRRRTTSSKRDREGQSISHGSKPWMRCSPTTSPKRGWSRRHRSKSRIPGSDRIQTGIPGGRAAVPCKFYLVGRCKKGRLCSYFHDETSCVDPDSSLSDFRGSSSKRARYPVKRVQEYFTYTSEEMDYSDRSSVRRRYSDYSYQEDEVYFSGCSSGRRRYSDYSALADEDMNYSDHSSVRRRHSDYSALKDEEILYSDYSPGRRRYSDYDQVIDLPRHVDDLGYTLLQRTEYVEEDMLQDRRQLGHFKSDYDYVKHNRACGSLYEFGSQRHAERYKTIYDAYSKKHVQGHDFLHDDALPRHGWRSDSHHDGPNHDYKLNSAVSCYGSSHEKCKRGSACRFSHYDVPYQDRWLSEGDPKEKFYDKIGADPVIKQRLKRSGTMVTSNQHSCECHSRFDSHGHYCQDLLDDWCKDRTPDDSLAGNLDVGKWSPWSVHKQVGLGICNNSSQKCRSLDSPNGALYASASSQSLLNEVDKLVHVTSSHEDIQNQQAMLHSPTTKLQNPADSVCVARTQQTETSHVSSMHEGRLSCSLSNSGSIESETPMDVDKNVLDGQYGVSAHYCQKSQVLQSAVEGSESQVDGVAANPLQVESDSCILGVRDTNYKGSADNFNSLIISHQTCGSGEQPKERPCSIPKDVSDLVPSQPSSNFRMVTFRESLVMSNCSDLSPSRPLVAEDLQKFETKLNCTVPSLSNYSSSVRFSNVRSKSTETNDDGFLVEPSRSIEFDVKETEAAHIGGERQGRCSSSVKFSDLSSKSKQGNGECFSDEQSVPAELKVKEAEAAHKSGEKQGRYAENVDAQVLGESEACIEDEKMLRFKFSLVEFVKDILNPTWKEGHLTKEAYKTIVKKTVDKVTDTMHGADIPQSLDRINSYLSFAKVKIEKLVQAYAQRYLDT